MWLAGYLTQLGSVCLLNEVQNEAPLSSIPARLASYTLKNNIALYSELIVYKCEINNHMRHYK
jgi:hypothetical protein